MLVTNKLASRSQSRIWSRAMCVLKSRETAIASRSTRVSSPVTDWGAMDFGVKRVRARACVTSSLSLSLSLSLDRPAIRHLSSSPLSLSLEIQYRNSFSESIPTLFQERPEGLCLVDALGRVRRRLPTRDSRFPNQSP